MARNERGRRRQARYETRVRYGPEQRGLNELAAEARDTLEFEVDASRGVAEGIGAAIESARPRTKRIYAGAGEQLDSIDADLANHGAMSGLFADAAARESAGADRRLEDARAGALSDLASREVQAEEGRAFAVRNAVGNYRESQQKIGRQRQGLRGDMAAFQLGTLQDLEEADHSLAMEERRLRLSQQSERRQRRKTEADITGIDPRTGLPTADEQNRRRDDARADRDKKGGPTAGEKSKHQDIVGAIQDAKVDAQELRRIGARWREIRQGLHGSKSEDNPYGGHGPLVSQAAVELARYGYVRESTMRALKARGLMPKRAPGSWRHSPKDDVRRAGERAVDVLGNLGDGF